MFTLEEKNFLLSLARQSIEYYLQNDKILEIGDEAAASEAMKERRACFVTLTIEGKLRGCIGHILPVQSLYLDVIDNAVAAAFEDPRFESLSSDELEQVEIEVSVLTLPQPLAFGSPEDLLAKLRSGVDGVILKQGRQQATFLPQVWEELPRPEDFLDNLCLKAGLGGDCWRGRDLKVETYQVEAFKEKDVL